MTSNGSRLRVLQVGKYFAPQHGGIESHLRDLCSELRKSVDLKVIVANDRIRQERGCIEGIDVIRLGRVMTLAVGADMPGYDQQHSARARGHRASASAESGGRDCMPARTTSRCARHHLAQ